MAQVIDACPLTSFSLLKGALHCRLKPRLYIAVPGLYGTRLKVLIFHITSDGK